MKIKHTMWFSTLLVMLSVSILPIAAQACRGCGGMTGVIYSNEDGRYYPVPGKPGYVYSSVDGKYYPVARYGYCCRHKHHWRHHCRCCYPRVECQTRPAHWVGTHWVGRSNVCWYKF